eukprot:4237195-Ditylum_brightwellii.AAC.3
MVEPTAESTVTPKELTNKESNKNEGLDDHKESPMIVLPTPKDLVEKYMHKVQLQVQRDQAHQVYDFLTSKNPDFARLNASTNTTVVLVCLPQSGKVKVLYRLGFRFSGIGETTATDGKLVALTGEGGGVLGLLHPMVLESTLGTTTQKICPQESSFYQCQQ